MSAPDWKDAPDWANWLAMDADGEWYWYETEPRQHYAMWNCFCAGRVQLAGTVETTWTSSLQARPE